MSFYRSVSDGLLLRAIRLVEKRVRDRRRRVGIESEGVLYTYMLARKILQLSNSSI